MSLVWILAMAANCIFLDTRSGMKPHRSYSQRPKHSHLCPTGFKLVKVGTVEFSSITTTHHSEWNWGTDWCLSSSGLTCFHIMILTLGFAVITLVFVSISGSLPTTFLAQVEVKTSPRIWEHCTQHRAQLCSKLDESTHTHTYTA